MKRMMGIGLAVLGLAIVIIFLSKDRIIKKPTENTKNSTTTTESKWLEYKNTQQNVTVEIPYRWTAADMTNKGNLDLFAVFTPKSQQGTITQTTLAVLSKTTGQDLTTQKEFDSWYVKENNAKGKTTEVKLMNNNIDGLPGVTFSNKGTNSDNTAFWLLTTWWRKDNKNYYVTTSGTGMDSEFDTQVHLNIVDRIRFVK